MEQPKSVTVFDALLNAATTAETSAREAGYNSLLRRLSAYDMDLIRDALKIASKPLWLPIETAPRDGTKILVTGDHPTFPRISAHFGECWQCPIEPTYWMPLPEPPR